MTLQFRQASIGKMWLVLRQSIALAVILASLSILIAAPQDPLRKPISSDGDVSTQADQPKLLQSKFYDANVVQTVQLHIKEADQHRMLKALPDCVYVPATFRWRDTIIEQVAVRFKGNSSSNPQQRHKRSYLIRFDKFEKQQRFLGLRRVSFDNGVQFGSLFSETIITDILRAEGINTHRCNYAKVYMNDKYQGVYVNVERIDESFLEQHFPDSDGGLWKNDLGGPGGNLEFIGNDPKAYAQAFEPKNKAAEKGGEKLVAFIRRINQSPPAEFPTMLESTMAVDDFLRVTAIMLFAGAFDQLTGWGPHNFYLNHDSKQVRWHYLPWDLDVGFCEVAFGRVYVLDDWHAAWPVPVGHKNPLLDRIIADPDLLGRYRRIAGKILEQHFEPDRLCDIIDRKYQLINADLQTDPFPAQRVTVPTDRGYDDIVDSLKSFVRKRYTTARQQLKNPGTRPKPVHRAEQTQPQSMPAELGVRIQQVMQRAQNMQQRLREISNIMNKIGPLVQQGNIQEAEALIEKAFKLTDNGAEN